MIIGAPTDQPVAIAFHSFGQSAAVSDHLLLVGFKAGLRCFLETDRLGGNHVHERPALDTGENLRIDLLGVFFRTEDQASARSPQSFVRRGGDEVGMAHGAWVQAGGD